MCIWPIINLKGLFFLIYAKLKMKHHKNAYRNNQKKIVNLTNYPSFLNRLQTSSLSCYFYYIFSFKCSIDNQRFHTFCKKFNPSLFLPFFIKMYTFLTYSVDTGRKLNLHKTFRTRPGCLLNVLCTFTLRPVCTR